MAEEYGGLKSNLGSEGWSLLGYARVAAALVVTVPLASLQYLMVNFVPGAWWPVAGLWHRTITALLGIRVTVVGQERHEGPVLYAANHISWLDIMVLGGLLPNASFIAKSEISGWGVIGSLCKLHKTVFVNRSRRTDSVRQRDSLTERVRGGDSLILFPEGTSTDGMRVSRFKSALFSVAEQADAATEHNLVIQPITLAYTEMNGMPLIRSQKPWVAWVGDMELFSHLRQFLGRARVEATLEFHAPITLAEAGGRKELAAYCEREIRMGLERAHRAELRHGPRAGLPAPAESPLLGGDQRLA
ncbi:lysophospholipid acyltransferase family protein [Kordiimonas marina]|uniref:lysophospholipid acyltransferase family protein n=1 Tax=Kordiimonas marina TaxID=2872312 RepID=UPI001FF20F56|nr:lysophospholipid acyltransferase family protein [Kordiimonas marina]MCJ9428252.1 1-acyl-sn-glycerol-3-phosphate acyltransferase [Kordiimonas marina]